MQAPVDYEAFAMVTHSALSAALHEPGTARQSFPDRVEQITEAHYSEPGFGLHELASELGMSERQVQRKFRALSSRTPSAYLRGFRLKKCLPLLRSGTPVNRVARAVGFSSHAYFSSCFHAEYSLTPLQYQRSQRL